MLDSPHAVFAQYPERAAEKAALTPGTLFFRAVPAGMFIALAALGATVCGALLGDGAGRLAGALLFPAGLAMVVLTGVELFTGNILMVLAQWSGRIRGRAMLVCWGMTYLGNAVGAALIAALTAWGLGGDAGFTAALEASVAGKLSLGFGEAMARGILCNVLVCAAVWMSLAARDAAGKVLALYFPVALFVLCGLEHCVANLFYLPAAMLAVPEAALAPGRLLLANLLPVTLGNLLGGLLFSGGLWAGFRQRS